MRYRNKGEIGDIGIKIAINKNLVNRKSIEQISENVAKGRYKDVKKIKKVSIPIFLFKIILIYSKIRKKEIKI